MGKGIDDIFVKYCYLYFSDLEFYRYFFCHVFLRNSEYRLYYTPDLMISVVS